MNNLQTHIETYMKYCKEQKIKSNKMRICFYKKNK